MSTFPRTPALCMIVTCLSLSAQAEDAHVHGVGELNLAIDGDIVEMALTAPAADIVGFEHKPKDEADHAALDAAIAVLKNGAALFVLSAGGGCVLKEAAVETGLVEGDHDDHAHGKEHDDDHAHGKKHDDDHVHGEKHDDDHHDEHADEHDEEHADFEAHYRFTCSDAGALTHMDVRYFEQFPAAQELDVQAITPRLGQVKAELTPEAARLEF